MVRLPDLCSKSVSSRSKIYLSDMSICHKPTLSFILNMICSESTSNSNAKWPIKSGAVDPELPEWVVLGI